MGLKETRALITAALEGKLSEGEFETSTYIGVKIPMKCDGVPTHLLNSANTCADIDGYQENAN